MKPYYAAMTRRWHANPHLRASGDDLASHGGRMAILALMFWPDASRELIVQCITHDLGEGVTGDIPWGAPNKDHDAEADALDDMGMAFGVGIADQCRVKFLDGLDAYLWARHHSPALMFREDWTAQREKLLAQADDLGVDLETHGITL